MTYEEFYKDAYGKMKAAEMQVLETIAQYSGRDEQQLSLIHI